VVDGLATDLIYIPQDVHPVSAANWKKNSALAFLNIPAYLLVHNDFLRKKIIA
jgi:hypothetical protein